MRINPWLPALVLVAIGVASNAADLRGQVTDDRGRPVGGAVVALNPVKGEPLVAISDGNGKFVFAQAPDGVYGATATTRSQGAAFVPDVALPRDDTLALRLSGAGPVIEGRVQVSAGARDSAVDVFAERVSDSTGDRFSGTVQDGRFIMSLPAGQYWLFARAPGLTTQASHIALSDTARIDLFLVREVGTNPSLAAELLHMEQVDQELRSRDLGDPSVRQDIARTDDEYGVRLRAILKTHGWPTADLVGYRAVQSAWVLLQHDGIDLIPALMGDLRSAAARGEVPKSSLALSIDRARVDAGKKQIYGSQFKQEPNAPDQWVLYPIEDQDGVDARRREMGMEPLSEYRKRIDAMYPKPRSTPASAP